jgi:hypothetical protein
MLQALVNVWWLFAYGFAIGVIIEWAANRPKVVDKDPHGTKAASSLFGDFVGLIVGCVVMFICGVLLLICMFGVLI